MQPALFELQEDGALLFSNDECVKRYTAEQAKNLEWKRNAIILLLGSDWPVETIASQLHISTRTVRAIAARNAQEVAGSSKMFARICQGLGARWLGLAKTKEHEASFLQLATAGAIAVDKAVLLDSMGQLADVAETKETPDRAQAMAALRALMSSPAADQVTGTDSPSDTQPHIIEASVSSIPTDAPGEAPSPPSPGQAGRAEGPAADQGGGGGPEAAGPGSGPMGQAERGLQPRRPPGVPANHHPDANA